VTKISFPFLLASVDVGWIELLASLTLLFITLAISIVLKLQIERSVIIASLRAAVQLIAVGFLFTAIFDHDLAKTWAWIWAGLMIVIATLVVERRVPDIDGIRNPTFLSISASVAITLGIIFPLGIFDAGAVNIVVISGITIGNIMPATVLAVHELQNQFRLRRGEVESLLALGIGMKNIRRFLCPAIIKLAIIQQVERTKVVGLIALPGAMTGLLLAGVDPIDAVIIQLIVMYMILGGTVVTASIVVWFGSRNAFTADQRLSTWTDFN
tara:strand:- start:1233 stop:2039 length:807 start_codon:yes stop_codon:yes gene_type:complete